MFSGGHPQQTYQLETRDVFMQVRWNPYLRGSLCRTGSPLALLTVTRTLRCVSASMELGTHFLVVVLLGFRGRSPLKISQLDFLLPSRTTFVVQHNNTDVFKLTKSHKAHFFGSA